MCPYGFYVLQYDKMQQIQVIIINTLKQDMHNIAGKGLKQVSGITRKVHTQFRTY